ACECHGGGDRKVDIARAEGADQHLAGADDDGKRREGKGCQGQAQRTSASREEDGDQPHETCSHKGPDPRLASKACKGAHPPRSCRSSLLRKRRRARTMTRIAPCAPICQSGEMRRKERKEPARASVSAPITAPTGDTR